MNGASKPVLLTTLTSAAVLDGRGDLELLRETRGAPYDWGGVYGQLVRLTGPWRISLRVGDRAQELPRTQLTSEEGAGFWRSRHAVEGLEIDQRVVAVPDPPGVARSLRITNPGPSAVPLTVVSRWAPFLLPVLVEGIRPVNYRAEVEHGQVRVRQHEFAVAFESNVAPSAVHFNGSAWKAVSVDGPLEDVTSEHALTVAPGTSVDACFFLHGGLERDLVRAERLHEVLERPSSIAESLGAADAAWLAGTPALEFPEAPALQRAYELARAALRRLYTEPGDGLVGLVAGYPWYSSIWCRDLAWMLPAVLWLGDGDWAQRSIASVFRFQARSDLPILGARRGEIPMQIAPGPIFLYGTSDTTLYYPGLVDRFVRHTGAEGLDPSWGDALREILAWGTARTDPNTGLIRNGGEALSIGATASSLIRVQCGIDSPDTTIWDTTDRRAHAIDLQVLWSDALVAATSLLSPGGNDPQTVRWGAMAQRVQESVRRLYPWPEEGYLFDSWWQEAPVRKVRPNALRAVSAGWFPLEVGRAAVERASREDLTAEWGVRTLSTKDPSYDPTAYHDGQVWTIATAWAADAALSVGKVDLGLRYLDAIARRIEEEDGWANECYRGDRAEPFNSCFLLGFSVAPFLTTVFERLWGLHVDARTPRLEIRPNFPEGWRSARLRQLTVGTGRADLLWTPTSIEVRWSGERPLTVATSRGEGSVPGGGRQSFPLG